MRNPTVIFGVNNARVSFIITASFDSTTDVCVKALKDLATHFRRKQI